MTEHSVEKKKLECDPTPSGELEQLAKK